MSVSRVISVRYFSISHISQGSAREGRFMKKILRGGADKKKWYFAEASPVQKLTLKDDSPSTKIVKNPKRVSVLNKLFMKHITDQMATGESARELLGHGIEINRVKIAPDFRILNVFWIAKESSDDKSIEQLLNKNAGILRHELSQLRVMGCVPRIQFVKDSAYQKIQEVDERLRRADFGDDYIPLDPIHRTKAEFMLTTPLEPHIQKTIASLEEEVNETEYEAPIPPMTMDVFGLNHDWIMQKVKKSMKKSEALHRITPAVISNDSDENIEVNGNETNIQQLDKNVFQEFLKKQRVLRLKAKKNSRQEREEVILLEDEQMSDTEYFSDDDDYIDDEDKSFKQ